MEFYVARLPVFDRKKRVFGYKLQLCKGLMESLCGQYREPDDAELLYQQLCFTGLEDAVQKPTAILDFSEELVESLIPILPKSCVIVEYGKIDNSEITDLKDIKKIQIHGYRVLYDATVNTSPRVLEMTDYIKLDYTALSPDAQRERIKRNKLKRGFYACGIETWEDFQRAFDIGYDFFQGDYFMRPLPGQPSVMRSFNTPVLRVMSELSEPEPSFKEITNIIEHDLNLSYSLLKLVNSAYIAPRFKVKTISQAITILGLSQLNEFMTTIAIKQMQSPGNCELLRRSLIRGKYMDLLAASVKLQQKGSEAFFTGIFSLVDVILGRSMAEVLEELPLTDTVKDALLGGEGALKSLLDMVRLYEKAHWEDFEARYNLDLTEQEKLMTAYLTALKWAESLEF
jgi:EAL and modified HD-GYP domain-containing signal transduction protein